jgi:hypothetical protein
MNRDHISIYFFIIDKTYFWELQTLFTKSVRKETLLSLYKSSVSVHTILMFIITAIISIYNMLY